jgi:hypothetical protein
MDQNLAPPLLSFELTQDTDAPLARPSLAALALLPNPRPGSAAIADRLDLHRAE